MSKGDILVGKKTTYNGIRMKSRLESRLAKFLDTLKIKWVYEPEHFMLSSGIIYVPDFYLPDLKMWIEAKGVIKEHNKEISRTFVTDNNTELILISTQKTFWFSDKDFIDGFCEDKSIWIGECSNCNSKFFVSNLGSYHCRRCNNHEGDHDLREELKGDSIS